MRFGQIAVSMAEGAILAHSVKHAGGVFRKGRVLSADDVAALAASGVETVFAARLEPHDVPEDEAAAAVARVVGGAGTVAQAPFTGRANLHAAVRGVAVIDAGRVRDLNHLHESLTLATVAPFTVVDHREMVATVKVIPFAVPRGVLNEALALIGGTPLVRVAAFRGAQVGLAVTTLAQTKPSLVMKSQEAIRDRLTALGGTLRETRIIGHTTPEVTVAIRDLALAGCDPILVFGASATVDRGDVIPQALVDAGGEVVHLGMPVDPGNLMMLGRLGDVPVIGVPSCARSPKLNGFDWVLRRIMAGLPVTAEDIMDMGAGGLLAEIPTRPSPRDPDPRPQRAPKVVALLLAAGQSSRMEVNKLLADVGGVPLVRRTAEAVRGAVDAMIAVTGRDAAHVAKALEGLDVSIVHNPDYRHGLSTSLKRGLEAVPPDADALLVCLADMPLVDAGVVRRLVAAFNPAEHRSICVPVHQGERGNPVLWGRQHFGALGGLSGDRGARGLFDQLADELVEVAMPDRAVLTDIDTPEALEDFRSGRST